MITNRTAEGSARRCLLRLDVDTAIRQARMLDQCISEISGQCQPMPPVLPWKKHNIAHAARMQMVPNLATRMEQILQGAAVALAPTHPAPAQRAAALASKCSLTTTMTPRQHIR
nr:hypothetical protein CFP56_07515 [Quercus suber]